MSAYFFDGYRLDVDRRLLSIREQAIPLSAKAFGVLHSLVRSAGRTVTKEELASEVWQNEAASDATIVQHVLIVRRLLEERAGSRKYILTVPRKGYRFIGRVAYDAGRPRPPNTSAIGDALRGEPRVWREYLTGIGCVERRDGSGYAQALQHFNAALALDRTFAPAWMGIAGTYSNMAFYGFAAWQQVLPTALRAIAKAIEFDRASALAHCVLAQIQLAKWDVAGAERSIEAAGNLDGRSAAVHQLQSFVQAWRGETDAAVASAKRAVATAPNDVAGHGTFAHALASHGDYSNAIASYSQILEVQPSCRVARQGRCEAYVAAGRPDLALSDLESLPRTPSNVSRFACIKALLGDELSASRALRELQQQSAAVSFQPHWIAQVHIASGRPDEAMRFTERAIRSHDLLFPAMLTSPLLHEPMKKRSLRQMLSDVRNRLLTADGSRTG